MDCEIIEAYHLPFLSGYNGDIKLNSLEFETIGKTFSLRYPVLDKALIKHITKQLRVNRHNYLNCKSVYDIIEICAEVTEKWRDPCYHYRKTAMETIPFITGFSEKMVSVIIDQIMAALDKKALLDMVRSELDKPEFLDEFTPRYASYIHSKAFGPEITANIFSGNIPVLSTLSIICTLIVKSGLIGKVSSKNPLFPVLFAKSFEDVDPDLAKCIAIVFWPGGDEEIEKEIFSIINCVIAYGGNESIKKIREKLPPDIRFIYFGHKISFGYVGKEKLLEISARDLARRIAIDIAFFDQYACMSPHCYYLERGGEISPEDFCDYLAEALKEINKNIPPGFKSLHSSGEIRKIRSIYEIKELSDDNIRMLCSEKSTDWTVIYEDNNQFEASCLNRVIRIKPIEGFKSLMEEIKPISKFLQTVGVELERKRSLELAEILGAIGVTRLAVTGCMCHVAGTWRHDGRYNLLDMIRWVDLENINYGDDK